MREYIFVFVHLERNAFYLSTTRLSIREVYCEIVPNDERDFQPYTDPRGRAAFGFIYAYLSRMISQPCIIRYE